MSLGRLLVSLVIVGGLTALIHYYLWMRLVRDPRIFTGTARTIATAFIIVGAVSILGGFAARALPRSIGTPLAWIAYVWLGVMFFLLVGSWFGEIVKVGIRIFGLFSSSKTGPLAGAANEDRRAFIAQGLAAFAGVFALGMAGAGLASALSRVAIKRVAVKIPKLAESARGYRIVQITDVHVGPTIGKTFIEEIVAQINALDPDLVAITGDLVDGSVEDLGDAVGILCKIRAKDGVFFVTGNHEYYSGADEWIAFLRAKGIRVLRNERVAIARGFDLAGVDDASAAGHGDGHGEDMPKAVSGRDTSRALVLLAHQPKQVERAAKHGVDLQLSGHTHGGQLFPWGFLVRLQQGGYLAGLDTHPSGTQIYTSCGTGYWGPPMRVGAPAEITEITLT